MWNGKPDRCYYFPYRDGRKKVWKKVGKLSEGCWPELAADLRAKTIMGRNTGQEVLTPKEEREERDRLDKTFSEIAVIYFTAKGTDLKGIVTDKNRYERRLAGRFGPKRISQIEPEHIEILKLELKGLKPATIWNILELLRRIINYGQCANRCPALGFHIEMPHNDNEVVECLTPDDARRFLDVVRVWPDADIRNMLLVAYFTGMRRGEIFKLEDRDVDFHMLFITIRPPKKGKNLRHRAEQNG
jgi:integrase